MTICTHKIEHSLGEIKNGEMKLSEIGEIVSEKWYDIPNHHDHVKLGEFIIMPNHIHGIIWIVSNEIVGSSPGMTDKKERICHGKSQPQQKRNFGEPQSGSLSIIINQFKGSVKRWCNKNDYQWFKWQRNYYEHIIRNNNDLHITTEYIKNNIGNWKEDEYRK